MNLAESTALWLLVLNLGVAFGAGIYEHRIVLPRWTDGSRGGPGWNAEAARRDDTGRRFWAFVTTVPLTLITLANVYFAGRAAGAARGWWLAAALAALADRALTFGYFIPAMVRLMNRPDSAEARAAANRWRRVNHLRHAIVLGAWLAALRTLERLGP